MKIEIKDIPLSRLENNSGQVKGLPANPRLIKDARYASLLQSIKESPEMLHLRELIVFPFKETFVVIGGNMRLRCMQELKFKTAPCKILPKETPVKKLAEYTLKDNISFGEMDWDNITNEWNDFPMQEWGLTGFDFQKEAEVDLSQFDKSAESYLNNTIRQIVLFYDVETHKQVLEKLMKIGGDFDIQEDNSATILKLIEIYEINNPKFSKK